MANRETTPEAEEDILGNVPGFEPDETGGADDNSGGNEAESGQEQTPPQGNQETQATDEAGTEQGNQQQQQQQSDPNQQQGVRYDAQGNVVDAKGNIIAPAGRWRRIDEQNNRLKEVVKTGTQKIAQLEGKLAEINFLNGAPAKYGLTNEEVAISLDMYNLFKNNPEQAVTMMLSEAAARGTDLSKILGNVGGINTQAINRMLEQRLAPLEKQTREQEFTRAVQREAVGRYNSFLASYPDAEPHQDAIANLMQSGKARDEEVAYHMLRGFAAANGLSFDQPLGPQIAARMSGRGRQQQQRQTMQKPMPNGRSINRQASPRNTAVASPERSYASIVDEALKEAGIMQ